MQPELIPGAPQSHYSLDWITPRPADNDPAIFRRVVRWAQRNGWTHTYAWSWHRPHTLPTKQWIPGGVVEVEWLSGELAITYWAPNSDARTSHRSPHAYWWQDRVTIHTLRQALLVLVALDLIPIEAVTTNAAA